MTRHGGGAEVLLRRRQEVEVVEAVLAGDEGRGVAGLAYPGFFGVSREPSSGDLTKSWTQAIRSNGRTTSVGLGGYPLVTLAVARERALDNARTVAEGRDPRRRVQRAPTFAQGHRDDNPAGDAISAALHNNRVATKHQRALPHAEVGVALARVRASGAYLGTKLALEFLVLTASRSGEIRQARCEEIDHDAAVWTIPGERMKTGRSRCSTRPPACSTATDSGRTGCRSRPGAGAEPLHDHQSCWGELGIQASWHVDGWSSHFGGMMATEPLAGRRMTKVTERRTKTDWAHFLDDIAGRYAGAERITLVMDNLNTHRPGALYETFPPARAKALRDRFDFVHTPRHGSWLNLAEVELNVMIRQCLNRRIDDIAILRREVAAWQPARDRIRAKVDWQFTTEDARLRLKRLYPTFDE